MGTSIGTIDRRIRHTHLSTGGDARSAEPPVEFQFAQSAVHLTAEPFTSIGRPRAVRALKNLHSAYTYILKMPSPSQIWRFG
jgi:hypothetical protein